LLACGLLILISGNTLPALATAPATFTVTTPDANVPLPPVVLQYDAATKTGFNWDDIKGQNSDDRRPDNVMRVAVEYLVEGVRRMTGRTLPVISSNDLSRGIVLTTIAGAPPELRDDPQVKAALRNTGEDAYNASEAFFIRSEKNRLLVIANRWDGLADGIAALMEVSGYEILDMGPDWIYTPDYHHKPLSFTVAKSGRPSFYIRGLYGGSYNGSTYLYPPPDPQDERIVASKMRWRTGWRTWGESMPPYPGNVLDSYHSAVLDRMLELKKPEGFLVPRTLIGPDAERPDATKENERTLWVNSDPAGAPGAGQVFISNGTRWVPQNRGWIGAALDLSVPLVRKIVLEKMKASAASFFATHPDDVYVFPTEAEDGAYATIDKDVKYRNWYPEYLAAAKLPFGRPYALQGFHGLNHPKETWDASSASDHTFAFNNWLLHEYDKWIDSLPKAERVTATGQPKKALIRTSLYSYAYHDVPPNFNLDPRIRVMVAGYPKHRGSGQWVQCSSYRDVAAAFKRLLPNEPSGEYRIISDTDYTDSTMECIPAAWSAAPQALIEDLKSTYDSGTKALIYETDFNNGKYGLGYYLMSKLLWNVNLTVPQLDALRDRWLQRAYGSAWREMKAYYDFMLPENFPSNSSGTWARAVRLLDAADKKLDGSKEPDARRRLDDMKQFWYFYYLLDSGKAKPDDRDMQEFMWKSQMSYVTATDMLIDFFPKANRLPQNAAGDFAKGPARYTHEETQQWWAKILAHWPLVKVDFFADAVLKNGVPGNAVEQNDLVVVKEFQSAMPPMPIEVGREETTFSTVAHKAGDAIGFQRLWPDRPGDRLGSERAVSYGLEYWDRAPKSWKTVVEGARQISHLITREDGSKWQLVNVRKAAPQAGIYRFTVGEGGTEGVLTGWNYNAANGTYQGSAPMTYSFSNKPVAGKGSVYFYIPKGTKSLDVEVAGAKDRTLIFYTGLPATGMKESRRVTLSGAGTHRVPLQPGEDGALASADGSVGLPYLYSVPVLWARSPGALLVPRAIAKADGLSTE
jgi:hypothetical protein